MLSRCLYNCFKIQPKVTTFRAVTGFTHSLQSTRFIRTDIYPRLCAPFKPPWEGRELVRKRLSKFRITMSEEEKARKMQSIRDAIQKSKEEKQPEGLFARMKFYIKRYWYIAIPVHTINCSLWFGGFYFAVRSGVDVVGCMETLHMPQPVIEKIKTVPETAGHVVVALILYKIATPLRYATTLPLIQLTFKVLKKFGYLRTAREVEYNLRNRYDQLNKRRIAASAQIISRYKNIKKAGGSSSQKPKQP